jgi:glycosyltransferase involved in cell wall biosynthesis
MIRTPTTDSPDKATVRAAHSKRTSVLFVVHTDVSRPFNGTATRSRQFIEHLTGNFDVHVLYMRCRDDAPEAAIEPSLPAGIASAASIEQNSFGYAVFDHRFLAAGARIMAERRCSVVLADYEKAGLYGAILARRHDVPLIYSTHDVEYERYLSLAKVDWRRGVLVPYVYFVERIAARAAAAVICITPYDLDAFARWMPREKLTLVPGGFDADRFNPNDVKIDAPPTIVFVGNLTYPPNREAVELISAHVIGPVLERFPETRFKFVGVYPKGFERTEPRAEFTGFVDDVSRHIKTARLVIVPVLRGAGMRIKTIEALACGKSVVATDKGAEGIDTSIVSRLRVTTLERFADTVVDELENGVAHDGRDFAALADTYSTEAALRGLSKVLTDTLSAAV